jgi:hypothetical protein
MCDSVQHYQTDNRRGCGGWRRCSGVGDGVSAVVRLFGCRPTTSLTRASLHLLQQA